MLPDRETAVGHDACALGPARDGSVVGDQHNSEVALAPQAFQQADDVVAGVLVQVARGLIGQYHSRVLHQRAGDRGSLLLAAG